MDRREMRMGSAAMRGLQTRMGPATAVAAIDKERERAWREEAWKEGEVEAERARSNCCATAIFIIVIAAVWG